MRKTDFQVLVLYFWDLDFGNRVRMGNHITLKFPFGNEILDLRKREDRKVNT